MDIAASHPHSEARAEAGELTATDWALLVLRVVLGVVFLAHGAQKVFGWFGGHGLEGTAAFMNKSLGVPIWLGYVASFTEFFGGLAVLLGVLARLGALGIAVVMAVAMTQVHLKGGFFLPQGFEYTFVLLGIALALVIAGPGKIAIADVEGRLLRRKNESGRA